MIFRLGIVAPSRAVQELSKALASFSPRLPFAVGLSGGADSTALLVACAEKWPGQVKAIHIHHGLQAAADGFEAHCAALCAQFKVPLSVKHINARHAAGESPEAAARKHRYEAFRAVAQSECAQQAIKDIAIAQHADDQVETMLLALLRGAGLPGLAAMPARWDRAGITYHRPLLSVAGAQLRAWLNERGVCWVEDPTNTDQQFTRNRIRTHLMPALQQAFPQFRETFARSARHAAQAHTLLVDIARQDWVLIGAEPAISALQELTRSRQANLLRYWLLDAHHATATTAQLDQLLDQIAVCRTRGHQIHLKVAAGHVARVGMLLAYTALA